MAATTDPAAQATAPWSQPRPVGPRTPGTTRAVGVLAAVVVLAFVLQPWLTWAFAGPAVQNWSTVFVSLVFQALPFLVLGVLLSAAVAAFVPEGALQRLIPSRPALAVPAAGLAGTVMPGCECGAVPLAGRLVSGGAPPAAALTFLLAAPAINPVVLVSTAVAFPGRPVMVLARFAASLAVAIAVGLWWSRWGQDRLLSGVRRGHGHGGSSWPRFRGAAVEDFVHAGGYLVVGAGVVALLQTVVPRSVVDGLASSGVLAVLALAALAVVVSICSEADAFVAASLSQFSATAQLAFLVVGPVVDVKLVAMQAGTFGRAFTLRFVPVCLVVALGATLLVGGVLL